VRRVWDDGDVDIHEGCFDGVGVFFVIGYGRLDASFHIRLQHGRRP